MANHDDRSAERVTKMRVAGIFISSATIRGSLVLRIAGDVVKRARIVRLCAGLSKGFFRFGLVIMPRTLLIGASHATCSRFFSCF